MYMHRSFIKTQKWNPNYIYKHPIMLKTISWQSIMRWRPLEMSLSSFCVGHVLLRKGPVLKCGLYSQRDSFGENLNFHFPSSYPLVKASGLGIGTCIHFPHNTRIPSGLDLCKPILWLHMHMCIIHVVSRDLVSLVTSLPLGCYDLF